MSKMSEIDQIHLRDVMLCMSKMSKMGKEYTHTFWLITSLILNGFSIRKKFWKAETEGFSTILCILKHVKDVKNNLQHLQHASTYIRFDGMVGKLSVSASQNFFRIENPLSIKEVMNQNVCACSFPIFDIFNIHRITALRCIWSIFDIFNIHRITFKWYHIKKGMIKVCLYFLFPSSTSSTYIALHPLGVFDLSSTPSTLLWSFVLIYLNTFNIKQYVLTCAL